MYFWIGFFIAALIGWVANIVKLVGMDCVDLGPGLFVARAIGIYFPPLGAVLGYF